MSDEYSGGDVATSVRGVTTVVRRTVLRLTGDRLLWALGGILLVAFLLRASVYGSVFRGDAVVLLGNDPFLRRFVVENHVAAANGLGDLLRYPDRDPLLIVVLSLASVLAGGVDAVGAVVAWHPVVCGVSTVLLVYALGARVTGSRPVGVVASAALALSPVHVARTALGYADHHAFDYLLLVVASLCLVELLTAPAGRRRVALAVALGIALSAQYLAWIGAVALVTPLGVAVVASAARDVAADRYPGGSVLAAGAFLLAVGIVAVARLSLGWATDPLVVTFGSLAGVVGVAVLSLLLARRVDIPRPLTASGVVTVVLLGGVTSLPAVAAVLDRAVAYARGMFDSDIAETVSLVGGPLGPLTGPLSAFGLQLFVALPFLVVLTVVAVSRPDRTDAEARRGRKRDDATVTEAEDGETATTDREPEGEDGGDTTQRGRIDGVRAGRIDAVVVLVVCTWYFLALSLVQRRFAGELSPFVAVVVAVAFVDLAGRVGLVEGRSWVTDVGGRGIRGHAPWRVIRGRIGSGTLTPAVSPVRERSEGWRPVALVFLIVLSAVAGSGFAVVKMNQSIVSTPEYGAARAIDDYAESADVAYPRSYVLSSMHTNRFYNYEVDGEVATSLSFDYAATHYRPFLRAASPDEAYLRHRERVGFVVTTDTAVGAGTGRVLHEGLGTASDRPVGDGDGGTGHYRLVYASDDGSVKAFELVPGATVVGRADPGERIRVASPVVTGGRSFTFVRVATATDGGWYAVRVPYGGQYTAGEGSVTVDARTVDTGRFARVGGPGTGGTAVHLPLDAGRGRVAFDRHGWSHGHVNGATWTDDGLRFDGNDSVVVPDPPALGGEEGVALAVRFGALDRSTASERPFARLVSTAPASRFPETSGALIGLANGNVVGIVGDGTSAVVLRGPRVDDGDAHEARLVWDGGVATLVVDGEQVDDAPYAGRVTPATTLTVGGATDGRRGFEGEITDVRVGGAVATNWSVAAHVSPTLSNPVVP